MHQTLLVETLLESANLRQSRDLVPSCGEVGERIAECEAIVDYLRRRFSCHLWEEVEARETIGEAESSIDVGTSRAELASLDNVSLLRYGTVLKYVCFAEAELADLPLDTSLALLKEARAEWRKRFGKSAIAESI